MVMQARAAALEQSIMNVANAEYERLAQGITTYQRAERIGKALESLDDLRTGGMPDYEEAWNVLFYMLWYQPKQVNLAYSIIKRVIEQRPDRNTFLNRESGRLHIVDFGCGSLAMQFAVALVVADALERGELIGAVHIDSIDPSQAMIKLGQAAWNKFQELVREDPLLDDLSLSFETITSAAYPVEPLPAIERDTSWDCWLSAIHAVYDTNLGDVKDALKRYKDNLNPDLGFITSFHLKEGLVLAASPFQNDDRYVGRTGPSARQFDGTLENMTGLRRGIAESIANAEIRVDGVDKDKTMAYLYNQVRWDWALAAIWTYVRR